MSEQNKALARRITNEVWNGRNPSLIAELYAEDFIAHTPDGDLQGPAGYEQLYTTYTRAFPDCVLELEYLITEGDLVSTAFTFSGTHTGPLLDMPPTGRQVIVRGQAILRVENGKAVEETAVWDTFSLMQQLGVVPSIEHASG